MSENTIKENFSNSGTRNDVRMRIVNKFALETPGQGKDDLASRYTYQVEKLKAGGYVYLRRPANLHNGFDFIVCVDGYNFAGTGERKRNYPKHEDMVKDLGDKQSESQEEYKKLFNLLEKTYSCKDITEDAYENINFQKGFPVDMLVKTTKWLFIEQDIRYWSYSGRDMLWNGIPKP